MRFIEFSAFVCQKCESEREHIFYQRISPQVNSIGIIDYSLLQINLLQK